VCEQCGCRRVPEIAELGRQHELIEELAGEIVEVLSSDDPEVVAGAAVALREALKPHVSREEEGIFKVAREVGLTNYYLDDLEDDHRHFAESLAEPETLARTALEKLIDELIRHIALEEYELFPATAELLIRNPGATARQMPMEAA